MCCLMVWQPSINGELFGFGFDSWINYGSVEFVDLIEKVKGKDCQEYFFNKLYFQTTLSIYSIFYLLDINVVVFDYFFFISFLFSFPSLHQNIK